MPDNTSNVGDLTQLAQDIEAVMQEHFPDGDGKPAVAVAFTLPPDYDEVHYVANVRRSDGIMLFRTTANKMQSQVN